MTLVTFAVPFESAAFRRRPIARTVRILHTGVGEEAARVSLELAVCEATPDLVIAAGFAGALDSGIPVGAIVTDGAELPGRQARFAAAPEVLTTAAAKATFRAATGADVVDMESAAIAEVCEVARVPVVNFRAISDGAEDDLGLEPELLARLSARPVAAAPRLLWTLATNGERRRAFLRLVRDCRTAQTALADGLELAVRRVAD